MENPIQNGWFGGTPIFGNIHLVQQPFEGFNEAGGNFEKKSSPRLPIFQPRQKTPGSRIPFHGKSWLFNKDP